jgi:hypothetical protein
VIVCVSRTRLSLSLPLVSPTQSVTSICNLSFRLHQDLVREKGAVIVELDLSLDPEMEAELLGRGFQMLLQVRKEVVVSGCQ